MLIQCQLLLIEILLLFVSGNLPFLPILLVPETYHYQQPNILFRNKANEDFFVSIVGRIQEHSKNQLSIKFWHSFSGATMYYGEYGSFLCPFATLCARNSDPFYIITLSYEIGHYFLDKQYKQTSLLKPQVRPRNLKCGKVQFGFFCLNLCVGPGMWIFFT